jgi:hypothetical protein
MYIELIQNVNASRSVYMYLLTIHIFQVLSAIEIADPNIQCVNDGYLLLNLQNRIVFLLFNSLACVYQRFFYFDTNSIFHIV